MTSASISILAPLDFTEISPVAANHALHIAERAGATVHFLHWVDKENQRAAAEAKMSAILASLRIPTGVAVESRVAIGDYMKAIAAEAKNLNARLIIIGTHGLQGMEYFTGTHAIRIIGSVDIPCLVVQERPLGANGFENIIVPMELQSESKQKLELVVRMAKLFESTIHLFIPTENDEFLKNALTRNLNYAKSYMEQEGIRFTTTVSEEGSGDLDHATFKEVARHNGDLIAITNWHETKVLGLFGSDDTQDIIINEGMTPVLVVNPKLVSDFDLFGSVQ